MLYISHVPNTLTTICTMYIFQTNPCHVLPQHMPLHVPRSHLLNQTTATSRVTLTYVNVTHCTSACATQLLLYILMVHSSPVKYLPLHDSECSYHCMTVHVPHAEQTNLTSHTVHGQCTVNSEQLWPTLCTYVQPPSVQPPRHVQNSSFCWPGSTLTWRSNNRV